MLSLVALAVLVSAVGLALVAASLGRGPSVSNDTTLVLHPGGAVGEVPANDVLGQLVGGDATTVQGFVEALEKARRDPRITNVLIRPSSIETPYWGKVQEMRDAITRFRTSGKHVVAFLEYGSEREYYLASAAEKVFLLPTSPLDLTGVASYEVFLRGAFDQFGAYPDYLHVGDYKTAINQFTEKGFTPAHREMSEALNRDMYDQLVRGIAQARGKTDADVRALLDAGPFTPQQALTAGLVDGLAYDDELDDRMRDAKMVNGDLDTLDEHDYRRVTMASLGLQPKARIAVLYVVGTIVSGKSGYDPSNGDLVGSDTIVEEIRRLRADPTIKAIVLRIDSPGGSSVASDVIWRELAITKRQDPKRPIVASMSDLAASGGYYVALPADVIVAQPGTLTGSIGVFMGKVAIGGTLGKVGIRVETVKAGENADIYSPFAPFSPEQRTRLMAYMQAFYSTFVEKVASSRKQTPEQIHQLAQGRVWTGAQAKTRGLVDELGGLDTAIQMAKARANIAAEDDVELVTYPSRRTIYEELSERFSRSTASLGPFAGLLGQTGLGRVSAAVSPLQIFRRGEPLALMPGAWAALPVR